MKKVSLIDTERIKPEEYEEISHWMDRVVDEFNRVIVDLNRAIGELKGEE